VIDLTVKLRNNDSRHLDYYVGSMWVGALDARPYYNEPNTIGRWDATVSAGLPYFFTPEEADFITEYIRGVATTRNVTIRLKL
jgi:hypothetical protein